MAGKAMYPGQKNFSDTLYQRPLNCSTDTVGYLIFFQVGHVKACIKQMNELENVRLAILLRWKVRLLMS